MTSSFKSKAPKISIYNDQEKRLRSLTSCNQPLKYAIKLNDEIIELDEFRD
jgi:hypothetical protein